jgi:hypothetical protein
MMILTLLLSVTPIQAGTIFAARDSAETEGVALFALGALLLSVATSLRLKIMRRTERETLPEVSRHTNH